MRLHRFLLSVALAGSVAASSADCATPTSITIDVYSEVPCDKRAGVVLIGSTALDSLPSKVPSATSTHCDPRSGTQHMGSVVVIPAAGKDSPIAFASMTTVDGSPADGCLQNPTNCIVAKRQLHFIPQTELTMRIDLRLSCVNVVCGADQTCSKGQCVGATLDLKSCASNTCDENALGPRPDPPAPKTIDFITYPEGAVGTTEQLHLVYAAHSKRWWLFYFDDATRNTMRSAWSTDLATWTTAGTFQLRAPLTQDARNFGVAYADRGGNDVIHLAIAEVSAGLHEVYRLRAMIAGPAITYEGPEVLVTGTIVFSGPDPDGTNASVGSDGRVYVSTGWFNQNTITQTFDTTGNEDIYISSTPDDGSAGQKLDFSSGAVHSWVPDLVAARSMAALGNGQMLAMWTTSDHGQSAVETSNLSWATSKNYASVNQLFAGGLPLQHQNDWALCATDSKTAHAVRRLLAGGSNNVFEHQKFDAATNTWTPGGAIANDPGVEGTGLTLVTNGNAMLLFAMGQVGGGQSLRYTRWDGSGWSPWSTLSPGGGRLIGTGCQLKTQAAIMWLTPSKPVSVANVTALF